MVYFNHFTYCAKTPEGETKKGTLFFSHKILAFAWLMQQGWKVETLSLAPFHFEWKKYFSRPIAFSTITSFFEQLLSLLATQWSLLEALMLLQQTYPQAALRDVITLLVMELKQGISFAHTLSNHFSAIGAGELHLIKMGENTGTLAAVLVQIIKQRKQIELLTKKMRHALRYPLLLLFISLLIVGTLFTVVIPQFAPLYSELGDALPRTTQHLLNISVFLQNHGLFLVLILTSGITGISILFSKTPLLKKRLSYALYYCPLAHSLLRNFLCSRLLHGLSISLSAHIPVLDALKYAQKAAGHEVFERALSKIIDRLQEGDPLYQCFLQTGCFSNEILHFIQIGEKSGQLAQMFIQAASLSYTQTENRLQQVSLWMEPAMMLLIGGFIAFIVLSLYSPILSLGQVIQ